MGFSCSSWTLPGHLWSLSSSAGPENFRGCQHSVSTTTRLSRWVLVEDILVTLWHSLTAGTSCRCSQHLPFGKASEREGLPGPGTFEHIAQHETGCRFHHVTSRSWPLFVQHFNASNTLFCLLLTGNSQLSTWVGGQVLSALHGWDPEDQHLHGLAKVNISW